MTEHSLPSTTPASSVDQTSSDVAPRRPSLLSTVPAGARLPLLISLLSLIITAFVTILPSADPVLYRKIGHWLTPAKSAGHATSEQLKSSLAKDPALGSKLPMPNFEKNGRAKDPGKARMVLAIMADTCSDCVRSTLESVELLREDNPDVFIYAVSRSTDAELKRVRETFQITYPVWSDPDGVVSTPYNVVWSPRAYLLSRDGVLLWKQPVPLLSIDGVHEEIAKQRKHEETR